LRKMEEFRAKEKEGFNIVGSQDHEVADALTTMKETHPADVIIVDSAGKTTDEGSKNFAW
jgi:hypothetical protein